MKRIYLFAVVLVAVVIVASFGGYWYGTTNQTKPANLIVVGTSADYPPYESLDSHGRYTGFDIDLMNIIAGRLGWQVQWSDMSFGILLGSVQNGKINAIIAAMSINSERQQQVDFSIPYYVTEFALLKRSNSPINITQPTDMLNYTIGTQTGSVQYNYLQQFINSSQLDSSKVSLYERFDQAVLDLAAGRIDLVLCEKPFAIKESTLQPVIPALIWASPDPGLGIALQKGDSRLSDINSVINDLNSSGILEAEAIAWLGSG